MSRPKVYDQDYFDRWYRHPSHRIGGAAELGRRVRMVVATAEYHLGRKLRSVLDVGCGEGRWRAPLRRARPGVEYIGVDSSAYVVERYGRSRGIRLGSLGTLSQVGIAEPVDLVVCADMLHYVPLKELRHGLATVHALTDGIAFLEALTTADGVAGDTRGFQRRSAAVYRRLFRDAGFVPCGPHLWAGPQVAEGMAALEGDPAPR